MLFTCNGERWYPEEFLSELVWPAISKRMNEFCVKCPQILFNAVSKPFFLTLFSLLSHSVHLNSIYFVLCWYISCSMCFNRFAQFATIDLFRCNNSIRFSIVCIAFRLENVSAIYEMHSRARCSPASWSHSGKWLIVFDFRACSKCRKIL